MRVGGISLWAVVVLVPATAAGGTIPDSHLILRNSEEILSLRCLLADGPSWTEIVRLGSKYAIEEIRTERVGGGPGGEGGGAGGSYLHHLELAPRPGATARHYRLTAHCRPDGAGGYEVTTRTGRFVPRSSAPAGTPALVGPASLRVLRGVLLDDAAFRQIELELLDRRISSVQVRRDSASQQLWEQRRYLLTLVTEKDGKRDDTRLRFEVTYDQRSKKVTRVRPATG